MDYTAVIIATFGFFGTLIGGYFTFRSKLSELKQESKNESQTAIRLANDLLFTQIQTELIRRDKRIEELESKQNELEREEDKRKELLEAERSLNRRISVDREKERDIRIRIERDFERLRDRVVELERENTLLKHSIQKIETGELKENKEE